MLLFIAGLVVGSGTILALYRLRVIPAWQRAVAAGELRAFNAERRVAEWILVAKSNGFFREL